MISPRGWFLWRNPGFTASLMSSDFSRGNDPWPRIWKALDPKKGWVLSADTAEMGRGEQTEDWTSFILITYVNKVYSFSLEWRSSEASKLWNWTWKSKPRVSGTSQVILTQASLRASLLLSKYTFFLKKIISLKKYFQDVLGKMHPYWTLVRVWI